MFTLNTDDIWLHRVFTMRSDMLSHWGEHELTQELFVSFVRFVFKPLKELFVFTPKELFVSFAFYVKIQIF